MNSENQYYVGIDFGKRFTRIAVFIGNNNRVKLYDIVQLPLEEDFTNAYEKYKARLLDVSNYLKSKKIQLKSAVTNLDCQYIRSIPHVAEIINHMPFNSIPDSLVKTLKRKALNVNIRPNEKLLSQYLGTLYVDDKMVADKEKLHGKKLRLDSISIVTETKNYVELLNASHEVGVYIEDVVPSNLTPTYLWDAPQGITLYIDFGSQSIKVCCYNQQRVLAVENFELGGDDITQIIAEELNIDLIAAEQMKCNDFIFQDKMLSEEAKFRRVKRRIKNENLVTLQFIYQYLQKYGIELGDLQNVIISGQGAKLDCLQDVISTFFKRPCFLFGEKPFKYFLDYPVRLDLGCAMALAYSSFLNRRQKTEKMTFLSAINGYFQEKIGNALFLD